MKRSASASTATKPAKRSKATKVLDGKAVLNLSDEVISTLPVEDVRMHLLDLATYTRTLHAKFKIPDQVPVADTAEPEDSASLVQALKITIKRSIARQMKWTPSCKTVGAQFAIEGYAQSPIFEEALGLSNLNFKQKKMSISEFESGLGVGSITTEIRWGWLGLKCENITIKWDSVLSQYKISGKYGLFR